MAGDAGRVKPRWAGKVFCESVGGVAADSAGGNFFGCGLTRTASPVIVRSPTGPGNNHQRPLGATAGTLLTRREVSWLASSPVERDHERRCTRR